MNRVSGKKESFHSNLPGLKIDIGEVAHTEKVPAHTEECSGKADTINNIRKYPENLFRGVNYLFRHCQSFSTISLQIRIYEARKKIPAHQMCRDNQIKRRIRDYYTNHSSDFFCSAPVLLLRNRTKELAPPQMINRENKPIRTGILVSSPVYGSWVV